jgi:anti-sigma B factor antagonist
MTNSEETLADLGEPAAHAPSALAPEPVRLSLAIHDLPEATVVDLLTAPQLATELDPILTAGHRHIAIDLTQTSFVDSAGLHALVNISNRAPRHFALICPAGTVRRTIELVGLAEPLCVVDSLEEYWQRRAGP